MTAVAVVMAVAFAVWGILVALPYLPRRGP